MILYKTTIVIWSDFNPEEKVEINALAQRAMDGDCICTTQETLQVEPPAPLPDEVRSFFNLEEEAWPDGEEIEVVTVDPEAWANELAATLLHEKRQFLGDVLITWVESSRSAGASWWQFRKYKWMDQTTGEALPDPSVEARCDDPKGEEGKDFLPWRSCGPDTVEKAFKRLIKGPVNGLHESIRARYIGLYHTMEAGDIDAGDADCIMQIAFFEEVPFG